MPQAAPEMSMPSPDHSPINDPGVPGMAGMPGVGGGGMPCTETATQAGGRSAKEVGRHGSQGIRSRIDVAVGGVADICIAVSKSILIDTP